MTLALRYAARSDVGLLRDGNEDSLYAGPRLLAVADGMGGHAAGEVASAVAIATLAPLDQDPPGADLLDTLRGAVEDANLHLRDMMAGDPALEGMGTTLTALLSGGALLGLVHVGDSRAYLLRDGQLTQITHDHTLVQALVDEGRISPEEAGHHPQRSLMLRALDGRGDVQPDLSVREARVGDRYLLCTDGLSGIVSAATIRDSLSLPEPQAAVDRLVELALRGGGPDNVTCIVADAVDAVEPVEEPILVAGAVAADGGITRPSAETAAGRAALASRRRRLRRPTRQPAAAAAAPRKLRLLAPLVATLLLAGLAAVGVAYVRSQYYLGAAAGDVGIYQGLAASVAGVHLSDLHERLDVRIADLPPFMQQRVRQGISAGSLANAQRIGARLRSQMLSAACPSGTPTPAVTAVGPPTPSGTASPRPSPAVTASPRTPHRGAPSASERGSPRPEQSGRARRSPGPTASASPGPATTPTPAATASPSAGPCGGTP